ncbi:MAG: hypothetical protein BWX71_02614 [Deltaproteobacteria bacterium ADurb.Bin072]|nr:MAG: hypothetical protein BWX71_02614 [Deltaproteobacteria bacterium ADurb.Bin072]
MLHGRLDICRREIQVLPEIHLFRAHLFSGLEDIPYLFWRNEDIFGQFVIFGKVLGEFLEGLLRSDLPVLPCSSHQGALADEVGDLHDVPGDLVRVFGEQLVDAPLLQDLVLLILRLREDIALGLCHAHEGPEAQHGPHGPRYQPPGYRQGGEHFEVLGSVQLGADPEGPGEVVVVLLHMARVVSGHLRHGEDILGPGLPLCLIGTGEEVEGLTKRTGLFAFLGLPDNGLIPEALILEDGRSTLSGNRIDTGERLTVEGLFSLAQVQAPESRGRHLREIDLLPCIKALFSCHARRKERGSLIDKTFGSYLEPGFVINLCPDDS